MASTNVGLHLLQTVNEIAGALNSRECRIMLYLCGSLESDSTTADVREVLKTQLIRGQVDDLFLIELLFELKRFDILWKRFGTREHEVERTLENGHVLSKYRVLMANINENITNGDLKNVKFLLSQTLTREQMDKVKSFLDIVVELEKMDKISSERLDFIETCLRNIGRIDLARKVFLYRQSVGAHHIQSVSNQINRQENIQNHFSSPTQTYSVPQQQHKQVQPFRNVPEMSSVPTSQASPCLLEEYRLHSDPRGLCLIIDCVGNDGERMAHLFGGLRFKVVLHKWLSVSETFSVLKETSKLREHQEAVAYICCIISRGTPTNLLATDTRCTGLPLDTVRKLFVADACPMLAGKPKLFFIQRYSVPERQAPVGICHRDEDLETDGFGCSWEFVPTDADVFWSHCWTNECQLKQGSHRSVYLQALTDGLLKGQQRKTHLVDVHTEVNGVIYNHNKRNTGERYDIDLKHTLRKNMYLQ